MNAVTKHKEQAVQVATPVAGEDAWLSMIERAARDPSVDVSKMERMFEMRERVMKTSAEQAFNASFVAVRAAVGPVIKNRSNDQTRSKYADLFAIADILDPVMTEHGFAATFGTADCPLENHYRITGTLLHAQGHSKEYHVDVPVDGAGIKGQTNKTATHAFGSTMTYGRRYLKIAMFDISITDNDGNRHRPQPAPAYSPTGRGYPAAPQSAGLREQSAEPPSFHNEVSNVPGGFKSLKHIEVDEEQITDHTRDPEWATLSAHLTGNCESRADVLAWWEARKKELKQRKPHFAKAFYQGEVIPFAASFAQTVEWEDDAGARG
jgi:hypothetical protein